MLIFLIDDNSKDEENKSEKSYTSMLEDEEVSQHGISIYNFEDGEKDGFGEINEEIIEQKVKASERSQMFHCNLVPICFQSVGNNEI